MSFQEKKGSNAVPPQYSGTGKQQALDIRPSRPSRRASNASSASTTSRSRTRPPLSQAPGVASSSKQPGGPEQRPGPDPGSHLKVYDASESGQSRFKSFTPSQPRNDLRQQLPATPRRTDSEVSSSSKHSSAAPSSTRSEPTRGRFDEPVYFHNRLNGDDDFFQTIDIAYRGHDRVLMLASGQGGTFVCGNAEEWQVEQHKKSNVFPMSPKYGQMLTCIGTKGCVTCTAVYMELKENRFFAAHIDVWPTKNVTFQSLQPRHVDEMTNAVALQLEKHAGAHGWDRSDVLEDKMRLICPYPFVVMFSVADGVKQFLRMNNRPKVDTGSGGFVIRPGYESKKKPGRLNAKFQHYQKPKDAEDREENVPSNFEEVQLGTIKDGTPMPPEWSYTCGDNYVWKGLANQSGQAAPFRAS